MKADLELITPSLWDDLIAQHREGVAAARARGAFLALANIGAAVAFGMAMEHVEDARGAADLEGFARAAEVKAAFLRAMGVEPGPSW